MERETKSVEGGGRRRICTAIEYSRSGKFFWFSFFLLLFIGKEGGTAREKNTII